MKLNEYDIAALAEGRTPPTGAFSLAVSTGFEKLSDFWRDRYLNEFVKEGGSRIKFISGRPGCGKTHFLEVLAEEGRKAGYQVVSFSAKDIWLHDFREIYTAIVRGCDLEFCLGHAARTVVRNMGYDPEAIPEDTDFMTYLSGIGEGDALNRRAIRMELKSLFLSNPRMDNNFALACSMLVGGILGHPVLEERNRETLIRWLQGDREIKAAMLRAIGLAPIPITKYNARNMLRSLNELLTLSGSTGLLVLVDNLDIMLGQSGVESIHYTKLRREDTYESIRQLIDEIDTLHRTMFVFAFDRSFLDNENAGIKSYQALWMRIQNEIISERFNLFSDIVDLDKYERQFFTPETLVTMSEKLSALLSDQLGAVTVLTSEGAVKLLDGARTAGIGLPRLVCLKAFGGEADV